MCVFVSCANSLYAVFTTTHTHIHSDTGIIWGINRAFISVFQTPEAAGMSNRQDCCLICVCVCVCAGDGTRYLLCPEDFITLLILKISPQIQTKTHTMLT